MTSHLRWGPSRRVLVATSLLGIGLHPAPSPLPLSGQGLPYRLPTTVVKLALQGVRATPSVWFGHPADSTKQCVVEPQQERLKSLSYSLAAVVVADMGSVHYLPITTGAWSDTEISVTLSLDGRLLALTGKRTSRIDTFGRAFGQIIGIAAATAIAGPVGGVVKGLSARMVPRGVDLPRDTLRAPADTGAVPMTAVECVRRANVPGFREIGDSIATQRGTIASLDAQRSTLVGAYSAVPKAADLDLAVKRVAIIEAEIEKAQSTLAQLEQRRLAVATTYSLKQGVTEKLEAFALAREVSLDRSMNLRVDLSESDLLDLSWKVMAPTPGVAGGAHSPDCQGSRASKCLTVMMREPVRWTLEGRVVSQHVALDGAYQAIEGVSPIAEWSPSVEISLPKGKLRSHELAITFDPGGQLVTFAAKDKGAASMLAEATAATLASTRDELVKTLEQSSKAQATILGMEQAQRAAEIKELLDQTALLDAQLAVATTEESAELLAAKKRVEVQLELLRVKGSLATEEANQTESATLLRSLTQEIALLRAEIEVLRLRQEAETSRANTSQSGGNR